MTNKEKRKRNKMRDKKEKMTTIGNIVKKIELWDEEKELLQSALEQFPNDSEMKEKILIYRLERIIKGHDNHGKKLSVKEAYSYFCPNKEIDLEQFYEIIGELLSRGIIESTNIDTIIEDIENVDTIIEDIEDLCIGHWNSEAINHKSNKGN